MGKGARLRKNKASLEAYAKEFVQSLGSESKGTVAPSVSVTMVPNLTPSIFQRIVCGVEESEVAFIMEDGRYRKLCELLCYLRDTDGSEDAREMLEWLESEHSQLSFGVMGGKDGML